MTDALPDRRSAFRSAIDRFLSERRDAKLDKLAPDDPKRDALIAQYHFATWIEDAARRVAQIQIVTHSLKPIHPDARGTNLYRPPDTLQPRFEIGSHSLGAGIADDVVGNAAALDVYKFLKLEVQGRTLLQWMLERDASLSEALSADADQAGAWIDAFTAITRPSGAAIASHSLAKQLYWLCGDDPLDDRGYQVLAPLYASSFAHSVFRIIDEDRFGADGKEARQAKREQQMHPRGFHEYAGLAIQKLGGTKPQNISQLNSERRGNNYLLASLPPRWKSRSLKQPWLIESAFPRRYGRREDVRRLVRLLRDFLLSGPPPNVDTRNRVDGYVDALIDEVVAFAGELQSGLPAGWSDDPRCELVEEERLWLDPGRAEQDESFSSRWHWMDWPDEIGKRFGNWLNAQLGPELSVGDAEQRQWRRELLVDEDELGWAWQLSRQRQRLDAPTYIPTRGATP